MSYHFHSRATADLLMLTPTGDAVLGAMGIAPAARGILVPDAMPAALGAAEAAIARDEAQRGTAPASDDEVTLRQRAWPLLEMLRRSHAEGEPIVWGP